MAYSNVPVASCIGKHIHADNFALMLFTCMLQLVLSVCIKIKFVNDIATIISDQYDIYLCSYMV